MRGNDALALLLVAVLPILGACAEGTRADGLSTSDADVRTVELDGDQVYNLTGKWLGEVAGVLLDPETGEVGYLVLSYREPRVYGRAVMVTDPRRFVPIPWALFTPGDGEDTLRLDADEMTLIPAPHLKQAPDSLSAAQASAIDRYWQSMGGGGN